MKDLVRQWIGALVAEQLRKSRVQLLSMRQGIDDLQNRISRMETQEPIRGSDTIDKAWHSHPNASKVFAGYHLHACHQCAVRFDETIQEAALAYDFSAEALLVELNLLLRNER